MQSFGIRFGQGFDRANLMKLMHGIEVEREYDLVVIGSSPGGVACAIEASSAGRRTALIKYNYTVLEDYEDSIEEAEGVIEISGEHSSEPSHSDTLNATPKNSPIKIKRKKKDAFGPQTESSPIHKNFENQKIDPKPTIPEIRPYMSAKIRKSNIDLKNQLFKRGRQGRKLMLQAANLQQSLQNARNFGWRLPVTVDLLSINWTKLSEYIMDQIMKENWILMNTLAQEQVEVIEGMPSFVDDHTVQIHYPNGALNNITADIICLALSSEYILPEDVVGASEYGITCDDFLRLGESPKNTLIVGGTPEALECAAIIACCGLPVTVITRSKFLAKYDTEMIRILLDDLKGRGIVFLEYTTLISISHKKEETLLATLKVTLTDEGLIKIESKEFDTVIFAVRRKTSYDFLNLKQIGIDQNLKFENLKTNINGQTQVPNIYSVDDLAGGHSQGLEISEVAGRLLGKNLFHNVSELMDYTFIPFAIFTPIEYAYVGISEETAFYKFGSECISIYHFLFSPFKLSLSGTMIQCLLKAIVYKTKDSIIGLHIFGPEAGEVIQGFAAAIKLGLTVANLQGLIGIQGTTAQKVTQLGNAIKAKSS